MRRHRIREGGYDDRGSHNAAVPLLVIAVIVSAYINYR